VFEHTHACDLTAAEEMHFQPIPVKKILGLMLGNKEVVGFLVVEDDKTKPFAIFLERTDDPSEPAFSRTSTFGPAAGPVRLTGALGPSSAACWARGGLT
jgi:hypothetical protein